MTSAGNVLEAAKDVTTGGKKVSTGRQHSVVTPKILQLVAEIIIEMLIKMS